MNEDLHICVYKVEAKIVVTNIKHAILKKTNTKDIGINYEVTKITKNNENTLNSTRDLLEF